MFRLDIDRNISTLYAKDEKNGQEEPVLVITKDGQKEKKLTTRTQI